MGHIGQKLGLVTADLLQLIGLALQLQAGSHHLTIFDADLFALHLQQLGPLFQLFIGLLQLLLLNAQLFRLGLGLFEQFVDLLP